MSTYGYETIKDFYYDETDAQERQIVEGLLIDTYEENKGEGLTPSELIDIFNEKLEAHKAEKNKRIMEAMNKAKNKKIPKAKAKKTNAGSKKQVKVKKAGKMRSGSIHNKQTT